MSSGMEEFMRKAGAIEQPEQLTPVAPSQPRADVITAGRKNAGSPAKLRRVGGEEADRREEEKEDDDMQPEAMEEKRRNAGTGGAEDGKEGDEEVFPTLTFPPAQRSWTAGEEGEGGVREPGAAWGAEEETFTGGMEVGDEGGGGGGGGAEARQEEDEEDGQGGNETPHAATEPWSDTGVAMEEDDDEGGSGEGKGGGGGIDVPPRPLPPGGAGWRRRSAREGPTVGFQKLVS